MNKISKKYKDSLSKMTVDELVNIILRKDDKEKEKNKQLRILERRIHNLKEFQINAEKELDVKIKEYKKLSQKAYALEQDLDIYRYKYNNCRRQNSLLRLVISGLGAIAIIEFLALILS